MKKILKLVLLILLGIISSEQGNVSRNDLEGSRRVLSRRKRFLIFPDGSSFQFVFCTQNHGYLQLGDIVWFGNTAAMAWELPTDTKLFNFFKKHDKFYTADNRDGVSKLIYFLNENGKILAKMPYRKKPLVNPAFAKRSINTNGEPEDEKAISNKKLHEKRKNIQIFDSLNRDEIEFHREGRKSLYGKLELYMQTLGWRGRECVLRLLCETGKGVIQKQSSFLGEIIKATFTLPEGQEFEDDIHKEYDTAHRSKGDCVYLYPRCEYNRDL
ncbi:unnamed protein product [Euphydryas editha]|uniref:Uncharacterized protein n=1 Tax=Euphydryas editha TaxID=104508 RepID=A0AAU9TN12_EUPED|nr:unnamed protein product [Euphydryas editha]